VGEFELEGSDDVLTIGGEELAARRLVGHLGAELVLDVGQVPRHRRGDEVDRLAR